MLTVERVSVSFGAFTAVDNVTLRVSKGEILGLVGPNGAGKTTLFNAISGLVKLNGTLNFSGVDISTMSLHKRARIGIGRTFQIPQPMHELTVMENLRVAQRFATGKVDLPYLHDILDLLNLQKKANRNAATELALSELKALEVAKALATGPQLLLLDEVLAGLETEGKRHFMLLLKKIREKYNLGILIVEHDIETIVNLCDRVCVLNFGKIIANGKPDEVFRDPVIQKIYTGGSHVEG